MNTYKEILKFTKDNKDIEKIPIKGLPDDGEIAERVKAVEEFLKSENAEGLTWEEYFSDTYEKLYALSKDGKVYDLLRMKVISPLEMLSDFILVKEARGNKRADVKHYSETDLKRKDKNFRGKNQKSRQYNLFFECELDKLNAEGETSNEYRNAAFLEDFDSVFAGSGFDFLPDDELKEIAHLKGSEFSDEKIAEIMGLSIKQIRNRKDKIVKCTIEHFSDEDDLYSYESIMDKITSGISASIAGAVNAGSQDNSVHNTYTIENIEISNPIGSVDQLMSEIITKTQSMNSITNNMR